MKAFIVYWHPEPRSFNAAMFRVARETLGQAGHEVRASDLHAARFDPVSSRRNFTTVKDAGYFKQQIEEMHARTRCAARSARDARSRRRRWPTRPAAGPRTCRSCCAASGCRNARRGLPPERHEDSLRSQ